MTPEEEIEHWKGQARAAARGATRWRNLYYEQATAHHERDRSEVAFWQAEADRYKAAMIEFAELAREATGWPKTPSE